MRRLNGLCMAAACMFAGAALPAHALVIGTADTSNSYPFGSTGGGPYFQQVYSAASFGAPISISQLSFYNSRSPSTSKPLADTFTIYLSTTAAAISTFDTSAFAFPDATFVQVFSGKLSALANGRLDIALSTAFAYDPSKGNLMLTVRDFDFGSGGNLFLDADQNVGVTNIRISAFPYDFNQGLVTGFNVAVAVVPEATTWAMLIVGFGMVGGAMRVQRRQRVGASFA